MAFQVYDFLLFYVYIEVANSPKGAVQWNFYNLILASLFGDKTMPEFYIKTMVKESQFT